MNNIYIFDVDGTLTPSRQPMTDEFREYFTQWTKKNFFFLVSGSDIDKLREQLSEEILGRAMGVFCCAGNKLYLNGELHSENKFEPPEQLIEFLEHKLEVAQFLPRAGNHIENRGAMLNFSVIGRDCNLNQRQMYFDYDNKNGERIRIAKKIREMFPYLDASIGGQISIDIYPKGNDKSQILSVIEKILAGGMSGGWKAVTYTFIGDRMEEGGNDYPLAQLMETRDDCRVFSTEDDNDTWRILANEDVDEFRKLYRGTTK